MCARSFLVLCETGPVVGRTLDSIGLLILPLYRPDVGLLGTLAGGETRGKEYTNNYK